MKLTKPQRLVYDMEKFAGGAIAVICGSVIVQGSKDLPDLKNAVQTLYRLNTALRIRIEETADGVTQTVSEYIERDAEILHFEDKAQFDAFAKQYAKEPLDIHGPLCNIKIILLDGSYGILVKLHHIIGDAWTLSLIASQFCAVLNRETPAAYSYLDYIGSEEAYMQSARYAKDRAFFLEQFKECDEVTYLSEKQVHSFDARRKTFVIEAERVQRIAAYAKECHTSPFVLFMTAFAAYINRTKMNTERFYIGTAVLNRSGAREKNTMGMFINTVPMLMKLDNKGTFAENLSSVQETAFSVFRHQKYNYGDVLADIRKEYAFTEKLYDVMLSYQNATITGAAGEFESAWYHSGAQTESLQIHIDDRDSEGIFRIHYDYQTEKFTEREIERMYEHMTNLLFDAIANDGKKLFELEILSAAEKQTLLYDFNDTVVDYPKDKCVHTLFEEQAAKAPDKTAVIACDATLTYAQLNEQANRIAHGLIAKGVRTGDIVAFALHRKSYLIAAIFGILKSGAAYMPIDLDYPQERVDYMLEDSGAKLFITDEGIEELLASGRTDNPAVPMSSDDLCYCIYTSGSTGTPKGTLIKHRSVTNFTWHSDKNAFQSGLLDNCDYVISANSVAFDITLQEIHLPLLNGRSVIFLSDKQVYSIGTAVDMFQNRNCGLIITPTKLEMYMADDAFCRSMKNFTVIMCGAEAFPPNLAYEIRRHTSAAIFDGYGPTETTCGVLYSEVEPGDSIKIGRPIANTQMYITDQYMQPTPIGAVGELCIAGDGVGAGYLHRPELTAEKFIDNPFGTGKLYKTGDLAYWREDGNIVYMGRNDFQVKIRGLRIELGEIENAIDGVEGISEAVVVVRKNSEGRQLICAFYTGREMDAREIRNQIGQRLPKYMLPHSVTHLDALPLTASGKADRKALPEIDLSSVALAVEYVAPDTPQEKALASAIEVVLGVERVGVLDNFFDLGGDSLKAIELIAQLEKAGYHVDTKTIFACDTIRELAEALTMAAKASEPVLDFTGDVPATSAQMRVYTAQSIDGDSTMYNVPCVFKVKSLDPERLERAIIALIDRHEMLRTRFENKDGQIIQIVEDHVSFALEQLTSDEISAFTRPFDLSKAPLLRAGYCENTVMIDMHHIVTDGGSQPVFLRELNELYMGRKLGKTPALYRQFAMQTFDLQDSESYWLSVFNDEIPVLEVNTDFKREQKRSINGNALYDSVDAALHQKVLAKSKELGVTPYVFYVSGFYVLLSKFSGNEDIVVGMPISGREGKYLNTIGMFVNTIALRNRPEGLKTVKEFLTEVKRTSVEAITHQNYPYGELVRKLDANTSERNPLFDVMFAYQSDEMTDITFGDRKAELLPIPITTSKYDFTFNVMPGKNGVVLMAEYCSDLYLEATMHRLVDGYKLVLEQMLETDGLLKDISAMTADEEYTLRVEYNDTAVDYPRDKCVHTLFEEQVARTPDKTAVIACDATLTFGELNDQANRIACALADKGIGAGDIVAFMLLRRSYLIATMFGILKTGAAYLPIDPGYPQERIDYLLNESAAKLCISDENITELLEQQNVYDIKASNNGNNPLCALHTSGSAGTPKLTLLQEKGCNGFITANQSFWEDVDTVVSTTIITFDAFEMESVLSLAQGFCLVLASEEEIYNQTAFESLFRFSDRNMWFSTPTKLEHYIDNSENKEYLKRIRSFVVGGEVFSEALLEKVRKYSENSKVFNIYGPTETTICSTVNELCVGVNKSVFALFEECVLQNRNKSAVIFKSKTLTYHKLYQLVENYAAKLVHCGVAPNDVVAVHLDRSHMLIVYQLAVLKIGAIFLPIDKRYPINRIQYMCSDCKIKLLVSDELTEDIGKTMVVSAECLAAMDISGAVETKENCDICYIIYTSGSTGNPKGCQLTGKGLVNFCKNNNTLKTLTQREDNVFACANSVSFDYFIAESLLPLLNGYTTVVLDDAESTAQELFLKTVKENHINVLMTTPTRLKLYFADANEDCVLNQLTCICTSGEALPLELLSALRSKAANAQIYNPLGPSECTVWNVGGELRRPADEDIHIGKPIANTQIYIVDKYMKLTPMGVTGELCIAGDGVGAGYLNRPELTAEKFIDNPFGVGKLYKTGDLAYWREDGNIAYVGRNDFQVKIRGLRIELGEIESAICSVDGVLQAVVVVRKDENGRQLICAFYTEREPVALEQIKTAIRDKLPRYMMPHFFTLLPQMPLTSSGKINRKGLPEIDLTAVERDVEYVKPEGELEKQLAKLMELVLNYTPVGRHDNFFDMGGDSLKAIEFVSKAHNEGIYFVLQNVFDYPAVQQLAGSIETGNKHEISYEDTDFSAADRIISKNTVDSMTVPERNDVGNILLAGATGYLGIHILADFLEHDTGIAYCLVRGKDQADSEKRFAELLEFYFDSKYSDSEHIKVICADLQKDTLGLDEQEYNHLLAEVDTVINTAASVKHYGSYRYFHEANVETVQHLIEFCRKADAKLIHTSTLSVSGNSFADQFDGYVSETKKHFYERSLYIGQSLDNVYARSKFEAERAVIEAMEHGLRANIMRMGNLTNRLSDGVFQKNYESNAFLNRVKAILGMGMIPDYLMELYAEFTPIDEAANAVMTLTRHFSTEQNVFHINSTKVVYMDKLVVYLKELGCEMRIVSGAEFTEVLRKTMEQSGMEFIYETFINDMDANDQLNYDSNIRIENDFTVRYLRKLGFEWSDIGLEYLRKYTAYFEKIRYFTCRNT